MLVAVTCSTLPLNTTLASGSTLPVTEYGVVQVLCLPGLTWTDSSLLTTTEQSAYCVDNGGWTSNWNATKSLSCKRMPEL